MSHRCIDLNFIGRIRSLPGGKMLKRWITVILILFSTTSLMAQYEGDDVYDPFADYSEFEENSQEEADINFFRNGRFFNIALLFGGRSYTGGMADFIDAGLSPGISFAFFFNMRLALNFTFAFSQHVLTSPEGVQPTEGNISFSTLAFDLKYYFNTNNVTRGLADLNPYVLGGFSQNNRTGSFVGETILAREDGAGFNLGAGIEIPVANNEMYIGTQFVYTLVNFPTENKPFPDETSPLFLDGDILQLYFFLGFNFL